MLFSYAFCIHRDVPELATHVLRLEGLTPASLRLTLSPGSCPEVRDIIFADDSKLAHARRWANRQGGHSTLRFSASLAEVQAS